MEFALHGYYAPKDLIWTMDPIHPDTLPGIKWKIVAITEARGIPRGEVSGLGERQAHRVSSRPVQLLVAQTRERAIAFNEG